MSIAPITTPKRYFELTHKSTPLPESSIEDNFSTSETGFLTTVVAAGSIISYLIAKQPK